MSAAPAPSLRARDELAAAARGFSLPLEGLRMLLRERRLWAPAALPVALSVAAVLCTLSAVVAWAGALHAFSAGLFPWPEPSGALSWLWIGPLRALFYVLDKLVFAALAALALAAAFLLANLLGAPFHDALSRRVEEVVAGRVTELRASGVGGAIRQTARALREEARRLAAFVLASGALAALGAFVPGGQLVAGPGLLLVSMLFLTLDAASYTLDRRGATFAEKRRWLRAHPGAALGFGGAALLLCAVPGVNLLALPVLVAGGTLLALRAPPRLSPAPAAGAGTPTSP